MNKTFSKYLPRQLRLLCLSLLLPLSTQSQGEEFSVDFFLVEGVPGASMNDEFSFTASIGQLDAGTLSGGEFTVEGGFSSIVASLQPPTLTITPAAPGQVTISWSPETTGVVLQETTSLSSGNWTNSPSGETNSITVTITGDMKFYRLFKP